MDLQHQNHEELRKIGEMIDATKFTMLTTIDEKGALHSRPMSTLQLDADGALWFFTAQSSPKGQQVERHQQVCLSYIRSDKQDYVSISGYAELIHDREKMKALWTPWIKPWFPDGLDDPDLALLKVTIVEAEYWDAPGSSVKRAYGLAKALVTGNTDGLGENGKVRVTQD